MELLEPLCLVFICREIGQAYCPKKSSKNMENVLTQTVTFGIVLLEYKM